MKQSKADFLREWLIDDPVKIKAGFSWLRYKNPPEKGVYWYYFSLFVRERDVKEYGTCISCGKEITVDTCDAGHFIPASVCGRDLLFDEMNVHAECSRCNAWDESHMLGYERGLAFRYSDKTVEDLKQRFFTYKYHSSPVKDWKPHEYAEKIRALPTYKQRMRNAEHNGV